MVEQIQNIFFLIFGMGMGVIVTCIIQVGRVTGRYSEDEKAQLEEDKSRLTEETAP